MDGIVAIKDIIKPSLRIAVESPLDFSVHTNQMLTN